MTPFAGLALGAALRALRAALREAEIANADIDARLLLRRAAGLTALDLATRSTDRLDDAAAARLAALAARRLAGEPVARILGEREFWGLPFSLGPDTLEPRPDTETVIETALRIIDEAGGRRKPWRLLDLGTGSGILLVSLLHELPQATGLGLDIAPGAVRIAAANARRNGVADRALFAVADWAAPVLGPFDLVLSNPPYIATADLAGLSREVLRHDPRRALDGGADGLGAYRAIAAFLPALLGESGTALFEIGFDQGDSVPRVLGAAGLRCEPPVPDLAGHPRVVPARRMRA